MKGPPYKPSLVIGPGIPPSYIWKVTILLEGAIFHWTMIMGGRVSTRPGHLSATPHSAFILTWEEAFETEISKVLILYQLGNL